MPSLTRNDRGICIAQIYMCTRNWGTA